MVCWLVSGVWKSSSSQGHSKFGEVIRLVLLKVCIREVQREGKFLEPEDVAPEVTPAYTIPVGK